MATLDKDVFGLSVENHELIKLAYDAYLANSRSSHAKTLKRGEVRGGGKKPWKQKGTGRARFGSTRNPIWRHGGVAFGRTGEENFTKKISRSAKLQAVRQALSIKNKDKAVFMLEPTVKLDGKTTVCKTDKNGVAKLSLKNIEPGTYAAKYSYSEPGKVGARASRLYEVLGGPSSADPRPGKHHGVQLSAGEWRRLTLFMDAQGAYISHDHDARAQCEGAVVQPILE